MQPNKIHTKAIELCKLAIKMTSLSGAGHPSSAVSLAHLITTLFYDQMRFDPRDPWHQAADRLVLSEGHAVPIVYAAYADIGGVVGTSPANARTLTTDDLNGLREFDSVLDGHPNPAEGFPFFDAATGSLGMGLSVAAGLALASRLDGLDRNIYCLLGDGESREGQIAEALDFIVDHKLTNVCAVFNCNGQGQAGAVSAQQSPSSLLRKLEAYEWQAMEIDGHNPKEIRRAFDAFIESDRPFAVVARTVKGWGVEQLQGANFHGKPLTADKLDAASASLDTMSARLELGNIDVSACRPRTVESQSCPQADSSSSLPPFPEAMQSAGFGSAVDKKKLATRRAYGAALSALGDTNQRIVALDGDVSNSTFADNFATRHPERFFECKIAEQNMISTAVGLAAAGKIPFASSFAKFISRAYDQVELAVIGRANIKIVGSHSGLGPASDGPSQMALADLAFFRSFTDVDAGNGEPACVIFQPADAIAAYRMTELLANTPGMCYMRTHRPDVPFIYPFDEQFEIGGSKTLRTGSDITLVASGFMVTEAIQAYDALAKCGIHCTLIDAYSLPLKVEPILQAARQAGNFIVTIEDNYTGGFGTVIAEAAGRAGDVRVEQLLVRRIPKSARTPEVLMQQYELSAEGIVRSVKKLLQAR